MRDELKVSVVEFGGRANYMLQWVDPETGKKKTKTSKVERDGTARNRKAAEQEAGALADKLREGTYQPPTKTNWATFRQRYEAEVMASLADGTAENASNCFNLLETLINPARLADLTPAKLSGFQAKLREIGRSENTIKKHLGYLLTALRWAKRQKLIRDVPEADLPKRAKGSKQMKGRPVTGEEFDRMVAAVSKARKMAPRRKAGRRDVAAERKRRADR